ncbi:MAG TPA: MFS transporter [Chloroflexota bacterium]|nr:MFS transporter [Chloroflexota bacterium]
MTGVSRHARQTLASLALRDFRVLWIGFLGTWMAMQMQQVARGYLAYKLSGNALSLGLVTLSMGLPRIVLSPIGGVMADRFSKRSVLMGTQAVLGVSTAVAGVMVALNVMTVPWLMVFGFVQGAAFSFNLPARQAYLPQLTGKGAMLSNAIALNSAGMNLTRVVGPALAGLLIAVPRIDVAGVYALTAVCFLCVWVTTYQVQNRGVSAMSRRSMGQSLSDGFRYIGARPHLLVLMSLGFVPLAIGMVYINLMPVVALGKLNIGSQGLGLLLTVSACGSLVGTLVIAYIAAFPRKAALQLALGVTFGLALLGFAFSLSHQWLAPGFLFLFLTGMAADSYMALNSTLILSNTDEAIYGRVMGVYMMSQSIRPITVLPMSALADAIGALFTLSLSGGFVAVFVGAVATLYPGYRRIGMEAELQPRGARTEPA